MKKLHALLLCALVCLGASAKTARDMDTFVSNLLGRMTLDEKIGQLNLTVSPNFVSGQPISTNSTLDELLSNGRLGGIFGFRTADEVREIQKMAVKRSRLHIPLIFGCDIIHGFDITFPIPLGLASSWSPAVIERMARISAIEASSDGVCWTFSPMVDICHDARWGRMAEGAGEDPYLGSVMAQAYIRGYQGNGDLSADDNIMACVKHYALYGAGDAGRDYNTVDMSRQRAFNEFMPPYKASVEAGAGSFMASFNEFEGIPAHINSYLINDVLRGQWGFDGFVVSDYNGISECAVHGAGNDEDVAVRALKAGMDMDMMGQSFINNLKTALDKGRITMADIDQATRRILEAKYKLGLFDNPYKYCDPKRAKRVLFDPANVVAAREIARQCPVLLKNDGNVLPLSKKGRIAVVGPLAQNGFHMLGTWSGYSDHVKPVSLYDGIRQAVDGRAEVTYCEGSWLLTDSAMEYKLNHDFMGQLKDGSQQGVHERPLQQMIDEAVAAARNADVVIAALGENLNMNGEGASRANPDIPAPQIALLRALHATGKPVVLVSFSGRPVILSDAEPLADAILQAWFLGVQAGPALADLLFGDAVPQGRLTASFPRAVGQLPMCYNHKNTGRPAEDDAPYKRFRSNYIDLTNTPLYPFGYGLSYTSFAYSPVTLSASSMSKGGSLQATVTVTNTGSVKATETVQLYLRDIIAQSTRPVKELKGFQQIELEPGQSKTVAFTITEESLKYYNHQLQYVAEPGDFTVMIGHDSAHTHDATFSYAL